MTAPIDWEAAVKVGVRAAPSGPRISELDAAVAVADLRDFSRSAELFVREVTGLGDELPVLDAVVVDRPGWVRATAEGMAVLAEPLTARLTEQLRSKHGKHGAPRNLPGMSTVAAAPIGTVLGYLSGKVLGQFDPFVADPAAPQYPGRLLLVAPNIVKVERILAVPPADFRLWVCLHESTHRLQFNAVPWLRDHFHSLVTDFAQAAELDPAAFLDRLVAAIKGSRTDGTSWLEATQTPEQRVAFDRVLALMTLLEGHADHVMDAVGPGVVPSVGRIRAAFSARRQRGGGPFDRLVRSLLGMDLKLQQYVRGAGFVRAVVAEVGMQRFNTVWTSPETLPSRAEIADPAGWIARVHR